MATVQGNNVIGQGAKHHDIDLEELSDHGGEPVDDCGIMQCADRSLPPEIRLGFVKKTYGLLFYMLTITFSIASPFVFNRDGALTFMRTHQWISALAGIAFMGLYVMNSMLMFALVCDCRQYFKMYMNMFKTFPHNVIFLTVISVTFGLLVGNICAEYKQESVVFVFFATSVMICGLTAYAVKTSADFTSMGAYVMVAVLGLMLASIISMFVGGMGGIMAGFGAMVFGFIIVYDTQLIFGNSTPVPSEYSHHQHQRQFEYTLDMYAFAAYQLYLDFINFFLYMLRLLGERRE
jgi:FtsH-binding integral membrane protein